MRPMQLGHEPIHFECARSGEGFRDLGEFIDHLMWSHQELQMHEGAGVEDYRQRMARIRRRRQARAFVNLSTWYNQAGVSL